MNPRHDSAGTQRRVLNRPQKTEETLRELSDVVGRKWHLVIVYHLERADGLGFNDLKEEIDDISNKVLSNALEDLMEKDIVDRNVISDRPFRVEYTVTDHGERFQPLIDAAQEQFVDGRQPLVG